MLKIAFHSLQTLPFLERMFPEPPPPPFVGFFFYILVTYNISVQKLHATSSIDLTASVFFAALFQPKHCHLVMLPLLMMMIFILPKKKIHVLSYIYKSKNAYEIYKKIRKLNIIFIIFRSIEN